MRISDWSSDVCSSDLGERLETGVGKQAKDRDCEAYAQPFPRIHGSLRKVASPAGLRCRRFGASQATSAMTIRARNASQRGQRTPSSPYRLIEWCRWRSGTKDKTKPKRHGARGLPSRFSTHPTKPK